MSSYEISKSSLLSLKAEILRKQEDLTKTKFDNVEKLKKIKKKSLDLKNKGIEVRQLNDVDSEEQDLLKLSRSKLQAKSKLYDKLSASSEQNDDVKRLYLVRFDKKNKESDHSSPEKYHYPDPVDSENEEKHLSDYYDEDIDPSEEWVEYTDCLGRTRKCLQKDLEYVRSKDNDLQIIVEKRQQSTPVTLEESCQKLKFDGNRNQTDTKEADQETKIADDEREMISGDMRQDMLRRQWEQEEEELRNQTNIHYQNVLFNEARQHGVGYYAFSKDEDERAKQQDALKQLRSETEQQQNKAQNLKALREKQMAARMKAARNRRRARLGLAPEEDEPAPTSEPTKNIEEEKKKKEESEKLEETESVLVEARKRHVRPWDIGKEGVTEFYEMTQEEWNNKLRQERPAEFAPPVAYSTREFSSKKSLESSIDDSDKSLRFSTIGHKESNKYKKQGLRNINPYKQSKTSKYNNDSFNVSKPVHEEQINRSSTINNWKDDHSSYVHNSDSNDCLLKDYLQSNAFSSFETNSYEPEDPTSELEDNLPSYYKVSDNKIEPVPIVNEVEETDFNDALLADYHKVMQNIIPGEKAGLRKLGAEIAPPPTFEYFGPTEVKEIKNSSTQINIAESIEAGLKFLRNQTEPKRRRCDNDF